MVAAPDLPGQPMWFTDGQSGDGSRPPPGNVRTTTFAVHKSRWPGEVGLRAYAPVTQARRSSACELRGKPVIRP